MIKNLKYTDSIFYEIILTGKYMKKLSEGLFKKLELPLTNEEFSVLDFLYDNKNEICQRDIAIKMLSDRANMGKILNSLEKKGYIKRKIGIKQNRPVKLAFLTKEGGNCYIETVNTLANIAKPVICELTENEEEKTISNLKRLRKVLSDIINIDI